MSGEVAAIVLAAGESTRMGRPKPLLDWGGKPLLQHQIDELSGAGCDPLVVVLGNQAPTVRAAITCDAPCRIVVNAAYRNGRASSLRAGAAVLPDERDAVVVTSVDGPCSADTVQRLITAWREQPGSRDIVVPSFEGKNGHPALFGGALLGELREVQEATEGLRAVRRAHADTTRFLNVDDPFVTLNLNTPEAYEAARAADSDR